MFLADTAGNDTWTAPCVSISPEIYLERDGLKTMPECQAVEKILIIAKRNWEGNLGHHTNYQRRGDVWESRGSARRHHRMDDLSLNFMMMTSGAFPAAAIRKLVLDTVRLPPHPPAFCDEAEIIWHYSERTLESALILFEKCSGIQETWNSLVQVRVQEAHGIQGMYGDGNGWFAHRTYYTCSRGICSVNVVTARG